MTLRWRAIWCGVLLASAGGQAVAAKKTAVFKVTAVHSGVGTQVTINSQVWVTPTQARAVVTNPLEGERVFLVSNGFMYVLDAKQKRGIKEPLPPDVRKSKDNFSLLLSRFAFDATEAIKSSRKVRTETVSGYACDVYSKSVTKEEASRSITVWMPQKMDPQFPVKAVMTDKIAKPGATVEKTVTILLSEIRLNEPLAASMFAVPVGYKIVAAPSRPAPKAR